MSVNTQTAAQWQVSIDQLDQQIGQLIAQQRQLQEAQFQNGRQIIALRQQRQNFPRDSAEFLANEQQINQLGVQDRSYQAEINELSQSIIALDSQLQAAERARDGALTATPNTQANAPPPENSALPLAATTPPTVQAANVGTEPAATAAVDTGPAIVRTTVQAEDPALVQGPLNAAIAASVAGPEPIPTRTIDPALGEGTQTVVVPTRSPAPVAAEGDEAIAAADRAQAEQTAANDTAALDRENAAVAAQVKDAQRQNTNSARVNTPASADWRVKLSLAPQSQYLYNSSNPGILAPLKRTGGVVFPYTPQIDMAYQAKYDAVDLTHSNYRGYFYRSSSVDQVNLRGTFTAQDTREAEYLLAVIAFFRSVTKMFYGATEPNRGMPPPLVFLTGLGQYQFNGNPCVVSSFQYNLPSEVDYIRANGFNNYGINMDNRRQQSSGPPGTGVLGAIAQVNRLINSDLVQGLLGNNKKPGNNTNPVSANNSKTNYTNSTYVPTKMEISLTLLPIQTRSQISQQFDLNKFAAGQLLQQPGAFW